MGGAYGESGTNTKGSQCSRRESVVIWRGCGRGMAETKDSGMSAGLAPDLGADLAGTESAWDENAERLPRPRAKEPRPLGSGPDQRRVTE